MKKEAIGVKVALFSVINGTLCVLVENRHLPQHPWSPGQSLESISSALVRDSVGIGSVAYIEQLYTFSSSHIPPFAITATYYALVADYKVQKNNNWVRVDDILKKSFVDASIVSYALQRLRWKIEYTNVAYSFLPGEFIFGELQRVYEAILRRALDKRNFRKKIFSLNILKDTGKKRTLGRARPAQLYAFKKRKVVFVEVL